MISTPPFYFSTKIAKSGQRVSHWPHWIHLSSATTSTFSISLIAKTCLGQNATQIRSLCSDLYGPSDS